MANYEDSYFQLYDIGNGLLKAKFYLTVYIGPAICLFAFVPIILVIVTILKARKKNLRVDEKAKKQLVHLKETFFTYMLINSVLN
jgi:hypothetical protein